MIIARGRGTIHRDASMDYWCRTVHYSGDVWVDHPALWRVLDAGRGGRGMKCVIAASGRRGADQSRSIHRSRGMVV